MIIDKRINDAILRYTEAIGGAGRLQEKIGVSEASAFRIGKGRAQTLRLETWNKLQPLIAPYLAAPDTFIAAPGNRSDNPARAIINSKLDNMNNDELECVLGFILGMPKSSQGNSQGS